MVRFSCSGVELSFKFFDLSSLAMSAVRERSAKRVVYPSLGLEKREEGSLSVIKLPPKEFYYLTSPT